MSKEYDSEQLWEDFWEPILTGANGEIDKDQLKSELRDFSFIIDQLPRVYEHVTGGHLSNHMYYAEDVIRAADEHFDEKYNAFLLDELKQLYNRKADMVRRIEQLEKEIG